MQRRRHACTCGSCVVLVFVPACSPLRRSRCRAGLRMVLVSVLAAATLLLGAAAGSPPPPTCSCTKQLSKSPCVEGKTFGCLPHDGRMWARPARQTHALVCAARTLKRPGQSRVTLSPRQEHFKSSLSDTSGGKRARNPPKHGARRPLAAIERARCPHANAGQY